MLLCCKHAATYTVVHIINQEPLETSSGEVDVHA
jgi:hypothetical protein